MRPVPKQRHLYHRREEQRIEMCLPDRIRRKPLRESDRSVFVRATALSELRQVS